MSATTSAHSGTVVRTICKASGDREETGARFVTVAVADARQRWRAEKTNVQAYQQEPEHRGEMERNHGAGRRPPAASSSFDSGGGDQQKMASGAAGRSGGWLRLAFVEGPYPLRRTGLRSLSISAVHGQARTGRLGVSTRSCWW